MTLEEAKILLANVGQTLDIDPFADFHTFERNQKKLTVILSARLRRLLVRARLWKSKELLTALKNGEKGFDPELSRSAGGRDGIFRLDRSYDNAMTRKIFGGFLDKPGAGAKEVAAYLNVPLDSLLAVRLVSHHLRLLGLLHRGDVDRLVLVDFDAGDAD